MKQLLSILLAALPTLFCHAQRIYFLPQVIYSGHSLADNELQGKVKVCAYFSADADSTGQVQENYYRKTTKLEFNEKGSLSKILNYVEMEELNNPVVFESNFSYDANGLLLAVEEQNGDSKTTIKYAYDSKGRVAQHEYKGNEQGIEPSKTTVEYNDKSNTASLATMSGKKLLYRGDIYHDAQGRIIRMVSYNCPKSRNCDKVSDIKYEYDSKNNLLKEESEGALAYSIEYKYTDNEQLVERISTYKGAMDYTSFEEFEYNDNGFLVKMEMLPIEDQFIEGSITTYKHDEQGNWVEMKTETAGMVYYIKREIVYY